MEAFAIRTADRALLEGLIDYAGLFPPAALSMEEAVAGYRDARSGPFAWLLGRFICTASRLEELAGILMMSMQAGELPWGISVILDGDVAAASVIAHTFHAEMEPAAQVALLEAPLPASVSDGRPVNEALEAARPVVAAAFTASVTAMPFFELKPVADQGGWDRGLSNGVRAIAALGAAANRPVGAKIRCGGVVRDAFPEPEAVVAFIAACVEAGLPFKATAGLHHPVRHRDTDLGVMRHGFLNLLFASALARQGSSRAVLLAVIEETDVAAFAVTSSSATWRDERLGVGRLTATREQFAAYGSCSFDEPVTDLIEMGILRE